MTIHRIPTGPRTLTAQLAADGGHYRQILHELIDMGTELARRIHARASAEPQTAAAATIPFDRVARAVRRSILLARRVGEPVADAGSTDPASLRAAARRRIIRGVGDAIQRHADPESDDDEGEDLHEEFLDRLDTADLDDDIEHLSVSEIIADICRDLGLAAPAGTHPWKRRTPDDIATLCARAAEHPDQRAERARNTGAAQTALIQTASPGTVHTLPTRTRPGGHPPADPGAANPPPSRLRKEPPDTDG